jgi:hypothetical protein
MAVTITQLRTLLQDTDSVTPKLTDDELNVLIALDTNAYRAAAVGARMIAAQLAAKTKVKAGPVSLESQQQFDHYIALAEAYDLQAREGGGETEGGIPGSVVGAPGLTGVSQSEIDSMREADDRFKSAFYRGISE